MFKLKGLSIHNFLSIEKMDLEFKPGLYVIRGYNELGRDSNGSGKSSILSAICWGLFGRTTKGLSGNDVRRFGSTTPTLVVVTFIKDTTKYTVYRSLTELVLLIDGQETVGHKRDIQDVINSTFRTSYNSFVRSTSFAQGQVEFLGSSTDSDKKKLFKNILQLDILDKYYDAARNKINSLDLTAANLDGKLQALVKRIDEIQNDRERYDEWDANFKYVQEQKINGLVSQYRDIERSIATVPSIKRELISAKKALMQIEKADPTQTYEDAIQNQATANGTVAQTRALAMQKNSELDDVKQLKGKCPKCGCKITKDSVELHKREIKTELEELHNKLEKVIEDATAFNKAARTAQDQMERVQLKRKELQELELRAANAEANEDRQKDRLKELNRQIAEETNKTSPYKELVDKGMEDILRLQAEWKMTSEQHGSSTKAIDVYSFLKWVCSKEGVAAYIIENSFAQLERVANKYLAKISNEGHRIAITPQRELKGGGMKEEIDVCITDSNGRSITYWGLSDGQRHRINVVLLLALNHLCRTLGFNSFDFILLDEVLDLSLDEQGSEAVFRLLEDELREVSTIILITHRHILGGNTSTNEILVTRGKDGISRLGEKNDN